jgi:hypothetical protein
LAYPEQQPDLSPLSDSGFSFVIPVAHRDGEASTMTPGVVWQLTDHYERGGHEAEQAHARLAARIRRVLPRRLGRVRPSPGPG